MEFVLVDHETGGERDVLLEPAGRLVVETSGPIEIYMDQGLEIFIRVYSIVTRKVATSGELGSDGRQSFPGLAVGTYDVKVEVGPAGSSPIVLGEAQVDVVANETSTARIVLTRHQIAPKVHVSGEIVLPEEYQTVDPLYSLSLRIQPADRQAGRLPRARSCRRRSG